MNKVLKVLSAAALSAVVAVSAVCSVAAAGLNAAEEKILDALKTTVNLNGVVTPCPQQYINQAENYFHTVDITDSQAESIVADIEAVKSYLESTGVSRYTELDDAQINEVVTLSNVASGEIEVSLVYDKTTRVVTAYDKDGNVIANVPVDEPGEGGNGGSQGGNQGGNSGEGGNGGSTGGNGGSTGGNGGVIKTTGFDVPSVAAVAGLGIVLVSASGVYLLRTSKKED